MREPWLEYIMKFERMSEIEDAFIGVRKALKDAGFKEEDLKTIDSAPTEVYIMRDVLINKIAGLKEDLMKYGIWNDDVKSKFDTYISRKLSKIEEKYPL